MILNGDSEGKMVAWIIAQDMSSIIDNLDKIRRYSVSVHEYSWYIG
jgi:hypothetical protein